MACSDLRGGIARRTMLGLMAGVLLVPLVPGAAWAQSLDEARLQGHLGERPDGYLGQVNPRAPAWALTLMVEVNEGRRAKYAELAMANGTTTEAVQVVAGEKIIEKLPPGTWYMDASEVWVQK